MGLWKSRQGDHYFCNVCSKRLDVTKSRPGYVPTNWFVQQGRYTVTVCSEECLNDFGKTWFISTSEKLSETEDDNETDYETIPGVPT